MEQDRAVLERAAALALEKARAHGATKAAVALSRVRTLRVQLRGGELEKIEHVVRSVLVASVIKGRRHGRCKIASLSDAEIAQGMCNACAMADFADPDPWIDLPEPGSHPTRFEDLDIWHPGADDAAAAVERLSRSCTQLPGGPPPELVGALSESQSSANALATSAGFYGFEAATLHALGAECIARRRNEAQRAADLRHFRRPPASATVADLVVDLQRTSQSLLGAKAIATGPRRVLLSPRVAAWLVQAVLSALHGSAHLRGLTFLRGCLHRPVFAQGVHLVDDAHERGGLGSTNFDNEGVATGRTLVVEDGRVRSLLLDGYSARRMGLRSTGHAGGVHNVLLEGDVVEGDLPALLDSGLWVERIHGAAPNPVTGDFSVAATGHWVEGGRVRHAVAGVAIAGNLRRLLPQLRVVGACPIRRPKISVGAILLPELMVGGS
jgi:PmbA protein